MWRDVVTLAIESHELIDETSLVGCCPTVHRPVRSRPLSLAPVQHARPGKRPAQARRTGTILDDVQRRAENWPPRPFHFATIRAALRPAMKARNRHRLLRSAISGYLLSSAVCWIPAQQSGVGHIILVTTRASRPYQRTRDDGRRSRSQSTRRDSDPGEMAGVIRSTRLQRRSDLSLWTDPEPLLAIRCTSSPAAERRDHQPRRWNDPVGQLRRGTFQPPNFNGDRPAVSHLPGRKQIEI